MRVGIPRAFASRVVVVGVPMLLAVGVTACGLLHSAPGATEVRSTTHSSSPSFAAWDQCLISHGVPVQADYDPFAPNGSAKPNADAAVIAACESQLPSPPPVSLATQQRWMGLAQCLRDHGIPAPDPSFLKNGDVELVLPRGVGPNTPGFAAAHAECLQAGGFTAPQPPSQ
jgi:hypothetical protein